MQATSGSGTASPAYLLSVANTTGAGLSLNVSNVLYVNGSSGNISIGATSPAERLSVTGNFSVTGNITLAPTSTIQSNKAICWLASGNLGYCSSFVAADGTCTCNEIKS